MQGGGQGFESPHLHHLSPSVLRPAGHRRQRDRRRRARRACLDPNPASVIHSLPLFAGRTAVRIASRIIVKRPQTSDPLTAARDPRRVQRPADFNADAATSFGGSPREGPVPTVRSTLATRRQAPDSGRDLTNRRVEASISSRMNSDATARSRCQPCASRVSR